MTLVAEIVVWLHLLGFAALVGGCLVQLRDPEPTVNGAMFFGAIAQFFTGLALVAFAETGPEAPNHVKVGVKFLILVVLLVLVWANRRFESMPKGVWAIITTLALTESAIAVFW